MQKNYDMTSPISDSIVNSGVIEGDMLQSGIQNRLKQVLGIYCIVLYMHLSDRGKGRIGEHGHPFLKDIVS